MKNLKGKNGITLIALILTIIIMLILATVTIGAINGGLFEYAGKAKKDTEEVSKVTGIQESFILAKGTSKTGRITATDMQHSLDSIFGANYAEAMENGSTIVVKIGEKYYEVDSNGNVAEGRTIEPIEGAGVSLAGEGTQAEPYQIRCIEDLVTLSRLAANKQAKTAKFYVLTKDLDFNSIFSYSNFNAKYSYVENDNGYKAYEPDEESETSKTIKELCTTGQGFIPIGLDYGSNIYLRGSFEGNSHTIKNIYINRSGDAALFGAGYGLTIKNLTVEGNITSTASTACGIIVTSYNTTINKCYNKAKITGKTNAAGIFGSGGATITECGNEGEITSNGGTAAGISAGGTNLNKCYNTGNVTNYSGRGRAAGLSGKSTSILTNCYNTGNITSITHSAGGLTVWTGVAAKNCCNSGKISGICLTQAGYETGIARYMSI